MTDSFDQGKLISEISVQMNGETKSITDWQWMRFGLVYLHYEITEPERRNGFNFAILQWLSGNYDDDNDPERRFRLVCDGIAFYDGVRHMQFAENGYLFCPYIGDIAAALHMVRELEIQCCWDTSPRQLP
jgi:hypothetical protein